MLTDKEVIVLVNFNGYLGGGETLLVRFASFLQVQNIDYLIFCTKNSYIEEDLIKRDIKSENVTSFDIDPNFYYLKDNRRQDLLNTLSKELDKGINYRFVTFTLRDLYTIYSLSKNIECSITHLVLHPEDDLYVSQTLIDKFNYKFFKKRKFNEHKIIEFNQRLIQTLNKRLGVISMTEIISKLWKSRVGVEIFGDYIIPLPSFKPLEKVVENKFFSKKIIWIGRIVDFKIPSLLQMIHFVSENDYELTIVGDGEREKIDSYIVKNNINTKKIRFLGQVNYSDLPRIINEHSIGYAMGTSLIELAKFRMPVIIALASFDHKNFKSQISGGLFFDKYKGCDGTDLLFLKEEDIETSISKTIDLIKSDYNRVAEACYRFAEREFSEDLNFRQYLQVIKTTKFLQEEDKNLKVPEAGTLRKLAFKYFGNE
ncbi:glycosyltransferase [Empedobacter sp.]|uniref:glycosyltransferase n=1 Tax=Empedobacter sp. TaxID=1927715 RepID=UPI0028A8532C|nr:glycosyltransferase [Empedobacter sp.]